MGLEAFVEDEDRPILICAARWTRHIPRGMCDDVECQGCGAKLTASKRRVENAQIACNTCGEAIMRKLDVTLKPIAPGTLDDITELDGPDVAERVRQTRDHLERAYGDSLTLDQLRREVRGG